MNVASTMKESFIVLAFVCFNFELAALQRRIYNGQNARANEFPYIALIRTRGMYCGGALISDRFVLTAAHCVMNLEQDERFTVVLGSHNYYVSDDDQKVVKLRANMKFWKHENFTMPSAVNDIAIIELSKNVTFSDNIKPISISRDKLIDDKRVVAVIAGWGETEKTEPDVLQTAKMKLIPINDCIKYQKHFIETLTETNICAFGVQEKSGLNRTIGPCDGDSGSISNQTLTNCQHFPSPAFSRFTFSCCSNKRTNWHNKLRQGC